VRLPQQRAEDVPSVVELATAVPVGRSGGDEWLGALEMGAKHGAYCIGCCAGLMLILFALGVMSLLWMALVAAAIFAEKVLPGGERLSPLLAAAFVVTGVWLAVSPGTFPGLVQP